MDVKYDLIYFVSFVLIFLGKDKMEIFNIGILFGGFKIMFFLNFVDM